MAFWARWGVALGLSLVAPIAALAGSYSVNPVKVELSATRPASTIRVRNTETEPLTLQVALKKWSQPSGTDQLQDTRELVAVPPVFTLEPGAEQLVRVGLRRRDVDSGERAFRLILSEIPSASNGQGLKLALTMSLPVFVNPPELSGPKLVWQAERRQGGRVSLSAVNRGDTHIKFAQWQMLKDGAVLAGQKQLEYLLPGTVKQWTAEPKIRLDAGDEVELRILSAGRELITQATVE